MIACFLIDKIAIACERARVTGLTAEPLVLTSADGSTVVVASEEAERYGVQAGQTIGAARALLPELVALPYDRDSYNAVMECVWDVYAVESDRVEPVSPEQCFVDLAGAPAGIPERLRWLAERIAPLIGVKLQIGLGRTKMIAFEAAKQHEGQLAGFVLVPSDEAILLGQIPLAALPQINRQTVERLRKLGVVTLSDVVRIPAARFPRDLKRITPLLLQLAQGHDSNSVRGLWPPRKVERSFMFPDEESVQDLGRVETALRDLAGILAKQLSAGGDFCREVKLVVEFERGACLQEHEQRTTPTLEAEALYRSGRRLLTRMAIDEPVRGLTLIAGGLGAGSAVQLALLDRFQTGDGQLPIDRQRRLDACLRYLRSRYGVRAIVSGALLRQARRIDLWAMPLGSLLNEAVVVATDRTTGAPLRYWRKRDRGKARNVVRTFDRWRERRWWGDRPGDCVAYRIEADPYQVAELHQMGVEWRLAGRFD